MPKFNIRKKKDGALIVHGAEGTITKKSSETYFAITVDASDYHEMKSYKFAHEEEYDLVEGEDNPKKPGYLIETPGKSHRPAYFQKAEEGKKNSPSVYTFKTLK